MATWWVWFLDLVELIIYVLLVLIFLAGCWVYVIRSPATHFGMAKEYEREGKLELAIKHYRLAAKWGRGRPEGRAALARIGELSDRAPDP